MVPPVEDFPQMWEKPSSSYLLEILHSLELKPPVWSYTLARSDILVEQESLASQIKGEVTRYLSSIVKSPLSWIEDDDEKEAVWTQASKRMSERCGRTAMGDIVRAWPLSSGGGGDDETAEFELTIREPALTGDSLGFKTWGSSYVLARHLPQLASTSLFRLFDESLGQSRPEVLELGSGTGLLGMAAAALWRVPVVMSDLPEIVENLRHNAGRNEELVGRRGGKLGVGALTWGGEVDEGLFGRAFQFKIVLAADPLYDDNHPSLLASAISQHLSLDPEARAVVMVPRRDETTEGLREGFKKAMMSLEAPLVCDEETDLVGGDDWVGGEEGGQVRCWLGIFSRGGSR